MRKKTQWIGFHDDTDEKGVVRDILLNSFGKKALQDEVLFFEKRSGHRTVFSEGAYTKEEILLKFHVHYPDLVVFSESPIIVVEIDGEVHWSNAHAVKRTNSRNAHYEAGKVRFLWLRTDEVIGRKTPEEVSELVRIIAERLEVLPDLR